MKRLFLFLILAAALMGQRPGSVGRWDEIYAGKAMKVPVIPSALVLETTANLTAGTALDIGMGNGRNAVYLARKGWKVTGIDVSREAVKQAQAEAAKLGTSIDAQVTRFENIPAYINRYDLVVCMYVQDLATKNAKKIVDMLKPGGLLVIEGTHADAESITGQKGYATNELLRSFGKLRILRYEDRMLPPEWGDNSRAAVVRLVAQKL